MEKTKTNKRTDKKTKQNKTWLWEFIQVICIMLSFFFFFFQKKVSKGNLPQESENSSSNNLLYGYFWQEKWWLCYSWCNWIHMSSLLMGYWVNWHDKHIISLKVLIFFWHGLVVGWILSVLCSNLAVNQLDCVAPGVLHFVGL